MKCKLDTCVIKNNFECCHGCDKEYNCERRCSIYWDKDCKHMVKENESIGTEEEKEFKDAANLFIQKCRIDKEKAIEIINSLYCD